MAVEQRPVVEERHGLGVLVDHHAWSPPLAIAQNLQSSMPRLHRAAPSPIRRRYLTDASPNARDMSSQSNQTPEASQEQDSQEQDSQERFTRVSLVAIFAGALASISAAVVASFLGVAGTLIGAALVSVVSSLAGAIYSGLLSSTHNLVRRSVRPAPGIQTERLEQPGRGWPGWLRWPLRRPATRWLVVGAAALLMFAIAIGGVTAIEAAIRRPLAAALGGRDEGSARTSVGAALGSSDQHPAGQRHAPSSSTAERGGSVPSSPSSTSTSGSGGQSGPPPSSTSPAATTSTPTPTTSPTPSTQPPSTR